MKFGLYGLHRGSSSEVAALVRRARMAEEAGFESLWLGDHVAVPRGDPDDDDRLEALSALAFLAGVTTRVRLAVGVLVMPQRQPVLLAKQLSSIDRLSGGRLTVGVGVGHVAEELDAFGVTMAERGARTDECIEAMFALWHPGEATFSGRWVQFAGVVERPTPLQHPHPPIIVGGHAEAALRRAAQVGDGWFGWDLDVARTARKIAQLRAIERTDRAAGRAPLEITVQPGRPVDVATARAYADAGVDRLVLQPTTTGGDEIETLIAHAAGELIGRG